MKDKEYELNEELDQTIAHLAQHMQALRESVPVNYELKARLKQRLLEQLKQQQAPHLKQQTKRNIGRKGLWFLLAFFSLFSVIMVGLFWLETKIGVLEVTPLGTYPAQDFHSEAPISVSVNGSQMVMEYQGSILLISQTEERTILTGGEDEIYHSPAWSNRSNWIAVVRKQGEQSELWLIQTDSRLATRLIYAEKGVHLSQLSWSEDDEWLIVNQEVIHPNGETLKKEALQIRFDGSRVYRHAMIEKENSDVEQRELLNRIRWPQTIRQKLEQAEGVWLDRHDDQNVLALMIRQQGQLEVFLVKLKPAKLSAVLSNKREALLED